MSRFQGKTIVITGASRGIGATLAKRFAREGGAVVASANESACETVAADIVKAGGKALAGHCRRYKEGRRDRAL